MTHTVTVGQFEGPLGILLELVEKGNLEVTAIAVSDITAGYLERIKHLDGRSPEDLSEFAQLGARLLYIKSLALLPGAPTEESGEELRQLGIELEEYRHYQHLARELGRRAEAGSWERTATWQLDPVDRPIPNVTLDQLSEALSRALARVQPSLPTSTIKHHVSLDSRLSLLRRHLPGGFNLDTILTDCQNRLEIIVTFLALLELIRDGVARVDQTSQFAAIRVEAAHA